MVNPPLRWDEPSGGRIGIFVNVPLRRTRRPSGVRCHSLLSDASKTTIPTLTDKFRLRASGRMGIRRQRSPCAARAGAVVPASRCRRPVRLRIETARRYRPDRRSWRRTRTFGQLGADAVSGPPNHRPSPSRGAASSPAHTRRSWRSVRWKPNGRTNQSFAPTATHVRPIAPVLAAISG